MHMCKMHLNHKHKSTKIWVTLTRALFYIYASWPLYQRTFTEERPSTENDRRNFIGDNKWDHTAVQHF